MFCVFDTCCFSVHFHQKEFEFVVFCFVSFVEYSPKEIKLHAHIIVKHFKGYKHPNFADKTLMKPFQKWWGMVVR